MPGNGHAPFLVRLAGGFTRLIIADLPLVQHRLHPWVTDTCT